jgi:hypothetical protein
MTEIYNKLQRAFKQGGFRMVCWRSVRKTYRFLRPLTPREKYTYSGVSVLNGRKFDGFFGFGGDIPDYKEKNIEALQEQLDGDEKVLIAGGGAGVTSVKAAEIVGGGNVEVVEAEKEQCKICRDTLERNGHPEATVFHGVIGEVEAEKINTDPEAKSYRIGDFEPDVVQMDIEGGECPAIQEMDYRPEILIVESHSKFGCPPQRVQKILDEKGYSSVDKGHVTERHAEKGCSKTIVGFT